MAEQDTLTAWAKQHNVADSTVDALKAEELELEDLVDFTDKDIDSLNDGKGLKMGPKKRLLAAIEALKKEGLPQAEKDQPAASPQKVKPEFSLKPIDRRCLESQEVRFDVIVCDDPDSVQWFSGDRELKSDGNIECGQKENKYWLTIKKATKEHGGEIKVEASNSAGSVSEVVNLHVVEKPKEMNVFICNYVHADDPTEDDKYAEEVDRLTKLIESFKAKGVTLFRVCGFGEKPAEYLLEAMPQCHLGIIKVPKRLSHIECVLSQTLQWNKDSVHRKVIPIYSAKSHLRTDLPEFLCNQPLFMDEKDFKSKMEKSIKELSCQCLDELYPLGDASKGLAMNYYTPTTILLSDEFQRKFEEKCAALAAERSGVRCEAVRKTIIAIPDTCCQENPRFRLEDCGEEFVFETEEDETKYTVRLEKNEMHGLFRPFTLTMYDLPGDKEHGDEDVVYQTRIEVPNIVLTLGKMSEKSSINFDGVKKLSEQQMKDQKNAFVNEIKMLFDRKYKDKYLIVHFNEKGRDLAQKVKEEIRRDKEQQKNGEQGKADEKENRPSSAFIIWDKAKQEDQLEATENFTKEMKEKHGVNVFDRSPGDREAHVASDVKNANLSAVFVWITNGELTEQQNFDTYVYMDYQDQHQFVQVIPVNVDGTQIKNEYLSNINGLCYCAPGDPGRDNFLQDAADACTGTKPLAYPIGPVYHGLLWTTVLNYIKPVIPERMEGIRLNFEKIRKECDSNNVKATFFPYMILLVEKQCRDSGGPFEKLEGIEKVGEHTFDKSDMQPAGPRQFYTAVFKVTHNNEVFIASFEYVRAVTCMRDIKKCNVMPISDQQMEEQVLHFHRLYQIAHHSIREVRENCVLLYYDEDKNRDSQGKPQLNRIIADCIRKHAQKT